MPGTKISALPAAGALAGTEPVPMVQGGATVKATANAIANTLTTNPLVVTGIKFGTSTVLSDYEEGTWTPTDASLAGIVITSIRCGYTKIGRIILIDCNVGYALNVSGNNAAVGGLPFAIPFSVIPSGLCFGPVIMDVFGLQGLAVFQFFVNQAGYGNITNAALSGSGFEGGFTYPST